MGISVNTVGIIMCDTYGEVTDASYLPDGSICFCKETNSNYVKKDGSWINTSGTGGSSDWGDIGGTLTNQTDLQNALDGKANSLGLDDNYVTDAEKTKLSNLSGTNTGDQTLPIDSTLTTTDNTTNNASTSKHGFAPKAVAPAANLLNVPGITNGETLYSNKALLASTTPSTQAFGDAAAVGTSLEASHADHKHAMPTAEKDTTAATGILKGNGSAISAATAGTDYAMPGWKCGITTRDINTASGTVNVAHGLGRTPKYVRVTANLVSSAGVSQRAEGTYDGTNHSGMAFIYSEGSSTAVSDTIYTSTAFELGFSAATVVNPYTGANRQTATITVDGTNIIFTWTKTGTVASAVANILWECE